MRTFVICTAVAAAFALAGCEEDTTFSAYQANLSGAAVSPRVDSTISGSVRITFGGGTGAGTISYTNFAVNHGTVDTIRLHRGSGAATTGNLQGYLCRGTCGASGTGLAVTGVTGDSLINMARGFNIQVVVHTSTPASGVTGAARGQAYPAQ